METFFTGIFHIVKPLPILVLLLMLSVSKKNSNGLMGTYGVTTAFTIQEMVHTIAIVD